MLRGYLRRLLLFETVYTAPLVTSFRRLACFSVYKVAAISKLHFFLILSVMGSS